MLAVREGNKALHVESKMSAAELKNSEEEEVEKEKPILRKSSILSDHDKDEHMFQSQPVHCHKKLVSI